MLSIPVGTPIISCSQTTLFPVLRPSEMDWITSPAFLSFQLADKRLRKLASLIMWAIPYIKAFYTDRYEYKYWLCFSSDLWLLQWVKLIYNYYSSSILYFYKNAIHFKKCNRIHWGYTNRRKYFHTKITKLIFNVLEYDIIICCFSEHLLKGRVRKERKGEREEKTI